MKPELEAELCRLAPHLYREYGGNMIQTCMAWGMECGDGWFQLLRELSVALEAEILKLPNEDRAHCRAAQVKEKYGTLRFYMDGATDRMDELIGDAETLSETTCEGCGAPGKLRGKGWLYTFCDACEAAKIKPVTTP